MLLMRTCLTPQQAGSPTVEMSGKQEPTKRPAPRPPPAQTGHWLCRHRSRRCCLRTWALLVQALLAQVLLAAFLARGHSGDGVHAGPAAAGLQPQLTPHEAGVFFGDRLGLVLTER